MTLHSQETGKTFKKRSTRLHLPSLIYVSETLLRDYKFMHLISPSSTGLLAL